MAVVGEAHIIVRAITNQVKDDINRGFRGADKAGGDAGNRAGDSFSKNFSKSMGRGGGRGGMFSNLMAEAEQAGDKFNRLVTIGYALGPAIAGLVSIIGSAASGLFALGAQAAAAGPALLSLLNVFSALAQGGAVLKVAFSGIGAALGAAGQSSGRAAADNSKQIEAAFERIQDARKRVTQVIQQNNERIIAAEERIVDAVDRERAAIEAVNDARESEADANEDVLRALQGVTEAREEAIESIQQLRFELEESVLSEQRAALGLEDARNELAKVQNLPPNNRQRREAELAFAEADLKLRRAKDRTSDTAKEVDEANAKGVEGSDQVVAAQERVIAAEKRAESAKKSVANAEKASTRATEDRVKAERNLQAVLQENIAREAEAREALKKAKENYKEVKNESGAAAGGVDRFAEAMANLSPKAQGFVKELIDIKGEFKDIKFATQDALFGTLTDDVRDLADTWFPKLKKLMPDTATEIGKVASKITDVLTETGNVSQLESIWKSNDKIIGDLGGAVADLVDVFIDLMEAAAPLAEEFAAWIKELTGGWKETTAANRESGKLAKTLDYAGGVAKTLGRVFGNLFRAIGNIGKAASGPGSGGEMLLDMLEKVTSKWEEFTGSEEGQARLEKFFQNIVPAVSELGGLIADVVGAFFRLSEASANMEGGDPTASFLESLRSVVGIFEEMGPGLVSVLPTIGEGFEAAAQAISNLTSSGAIEIFFGVLKEFAVLAKNITGNEIFQQIFAVVAPAFALSRALKLVLTFLRFIFLGAIVSKIGTFVSTFKTFQVVVGKLKFGLFAIKYFFVVFSTPILIATAAIAGLVAIFVAMYRESEIFRKAIKDLVDGVLEKAITIFETLKQKLEDALAPLGGLEGGMDILSKAVDGLRAAFKWLGDILGAYVIPFLEGGLKNALDIVGAIFGTIIDTVGNFIAAFMRIFNGIKTGDVSEIFGGIVDAIIAPFKALITNLVDLFKNIWNNVVEAVKTVLGISSPSTVFVEIATNIFDAIIGVITFLPEKFLEFFTSMWTKASDFFTKTIGPALLGWPAKIAGWIKGLWDKFFGFLKDVWDKIVAFYGPNGVVATFLKGLPRKIVNWVTGMWDGIYDALQTIYNKIVDFFGYDSDIGKFIRGLAKTITGWASSMWSGLTSGLSTAIGLIKSGLRPIATILNALIKGANFIAAATGSSFRISEIPMENLAEGGTVFPRPGGVIARIAEAGRPERVEPLDPDGLSKRDKAMINMLSGGGGGATINVYPSEGMNERELAEMVSRELAFMMRRGGI